MPDQGAISTAYVLFEIAGTTYAVPSENVLHLEMVERITPVPDTYPYVEGVFFSRGLILPAISLRIRFGLERIDYGLSTRLIVTRIGERIVGFIVDSAREFLTIAPETILPPPEEMSEISGNYISGVARMGERLVLMLDLAEVIKPAEAAGLPPSRDQDGAASPGAQATSPGEST